VREGCSSSFYLKGSTFLYGRSGSSGTARRSKGRHKGCPCCMGCVLLERGDLEQTHPVDGPREPAAGGGKGLVGLQDTIIATTTTTIIIIGECDTYD
jgi:hypothetical protein